MDCVWVTKSVSLALLYRYCHYMGITIGVAVLTPPAEL